MIRPVPESFVSIRAMRHEDVAHVSDIERRSYDFPWGHGVFRECLLAGYECMVLDRDGEVAGYGILSVGGGDSGGHALS
ncbi:MAG: ribosomal-protein-alanine N-acetyltransferase, partial [Desulfobulbaceae bacterium]|nr:ribosomal-protein-alanine N-acetyltransferase [Desulfobulbaceae bacterium]